MLLISVLIPGSKIAYTPVKQGRHLRHFKGVHLPLY